MSSSSQVAESWISAFCGLVGHEYFAEVSEDFIEDDFNLTGLQSQVPMYKEALEMILDVEPEDDDISDEDDDDDDRSDDMEPSYHDPYVSRREERRHLRMASDLSVIESSAEMLYGLIHQRFITSRQGIQQMAEKYEMGHFGFCPRVFCGSAKVLPVGCSDIPGQETVKLFCPSCLDVYTPPNSRFQSVDGAFFGTTFGCLFFMTFPELDVGGQKIVVSTPSLADQQPLESSRRRSSLTSSVSNNTATPTAASNTSHHHGHHKEKTLPPQPSSINGMASHNLAPGLGSGNIYEPRIYGFRVSEFAKSGPRMKWLRMRPADINELNEVAIWEQVRAYSEQQPDASSGPSAATDSTAAGGKEGDGSEDMDVLDEEEDPEEGSLENADEQALAGGASASNGSRRAAGGRRRVGDDIEGGGARV
ncbi:hypothetical protein AAFC00_005536 [Neodothiora populina]|uniref:Casein kinase II subunit beta n=1 Tax=Neodothiora populina TaxID=2781224 RepID=A0ABR3PMA6_9PEZI